VSDTRNATPKLGVYDRWLKHKEGHKLTSMVSTKTNVYGKTEATKVPRATLLGALQKLGPLHATHKLAAARGYVELTANVKNFTGFVVSPAPKSAAPRDPVP
jgi:hypothetical protein